MEISEKLVHKVKNPDSQVLKDLWGKSKRKTKKKMVEAGYDTSNFEVGKLAYAYYYDWRHDNPDYMFLVQNPGMFQMDRHGGDELTELKNADLLEAIDISKKYAVKWLTGRNRQFSKKFFGTLKDEGLIEFDDWKNYLESRKFFDDFMLTDVVKYRVDTSDIESEHTKASLQETLKDEIEAVEPEIIFCFSSRSWKSLWRNTDVEPIEHQPEKPEKITGVHGRLFYAQEFDTYVIPLSHFSGQNHFLRNSYYDYLEEGIEKWKDVR